MVVFVTDYPMRVVVRLIDKGVCIYIVHRIVRFCVVQPFTCGLDVSQPIPCFPSVFDQPPLFS